MRSHDSRRPQPVDDETSAFDSDVLAGLNTTPKRTTGKIFLRQCRLAIVRAHHRAAGILSDALRDAHFARPCARYRQARPARRGAGRIWQRFEQEGAHSAARLAAARGLRAGRYLRRDDRAGSARAAAGFSGAEGAAGDRRFHTKFCASGTGDKPRQCASDFSRARLSAISSRTRRRPSCAMPAAFWAPARR